MGKYPEAISQWEKVPAWDKNYLEAQLRISETRRQLQERSARSEKKILIERLSRSGEAAFRKKNYLKARADWKRVLRLDPTNAQAEQRLKDVDFIISSSDRVFYNRGVTFYNQGLLNAAKQEFERALKINPDNTKAAQYLQAISRVNYILYTFKKGDTLAKIAKSYTRNAEDAKILVDFNNLDDPSKVKPGEVLKIPQIKGFKLVARREKPDDGAEEFSLETVPKEESSPRDKTVSSLLEEGILLYTEGNYKEALNLFEKVLAEDPTSYEAKRYLLLTKENLKEEPSAQKDVEIPEEEETEAPKYATGQKETDEAQAKIEKILERGLSYKERQEYAEAIAEFEKVLNLDPDHAQAKAYLEESREALQKQATFHLNEGIRYFNNQQLEQAIAEWDKVLAINPDNQKARDYQQRAFTMLEKLRTLQNSQGQPEQSN